MTYVIVLIAVLSRFAPHPPNFSPVYAALLFGGAYLRRRDFLWFPLVVLSASDYLLTTFIYRMPFGWGEIAALVAFAAVALVGRALCRKISPPRIAAAVLAGPTAFFLISNFGVWLGWRMYPPTWAGLMACYVAAVPFFGNSLVSSVLFSSVLFGAYEYYRRKFASPLNSAVRLG